MTTMTLDKIIDDSTVTVPTLNMRLLVDDIRRTGVRTPILVRPSGRPGYYAIVDGRGRYRAALIAGLTEIPCEILPLTEAGGLRHGRRANMATE